MAAAAMDALGARTVVPLMVRRRAVSTRLARRQQRRCRALRAKQQACREALSRKLDTGTLKAGLIGDRRACCDAFVEHQQAMCLLRRHGAECNTLPDAAHPCDRRVRGQ